MFYDEFQVLIFKIYFGNFLGNIETRENKPGQISRNVELRNELDLFAYIMNCKSFPGIETRHKDIDILIIRQNTEGEYAMLEHEVFSTCIHFFEKIFNCFI